MAAFGRDDYIRLVEEAYFGGVMREDMAAVRACFTADARVTIYHGDNPVRRFYAAPQAGEQPLEAFYGHLNGNYHARFEGFVHFVDVPHARCAAMFTVTLTPKAGSAYAAAGTLTLNNCNFFLCRDGRIADMTIYYANPALGARLGAGASGPTGFPKD